MPRLCSEGKKMINTILFISVIALMFVLISLLFIIMMEVRAKKSYDHYVMESLNDKDEKAATDREDSEKIERTIPEPVQKKSDNKEPIEISEKEEDSTPKTPFTLAPKTASCNESCDKSRIDEIFKKDYGVFSHQRLVETMGLSDDEADEFVLELIHQLEDAIAELDRRVEEGDFEEIEHITHGLKGAALNIGSGGVADILVDYNQEMKESKSAETAKAYQELLRRSVSDLKIEYSQVA